MRNTRSFIALGLLFTALVATPKARAVEGFYLGGSVGFVGLTGAAKVFDNGLGFGADLGVKVNSYMDLLYHFQYSSHKNLGDLKIFANFIGADFQILDVHDLYVTVGAGPGLYIFKTAAGSGTNFGLHAGTEIGVRIEEALKIGVGFRYHLIFSPTAGDNYFTVMASLGYTFGG